MPKTDIVPESLIMRRFSDRTHLFAGLLLAGTLLLPSPGFAGDEGRRPAARRKAQRVVLRGKLASVRTDIRDTRIKLRQAKRSEETIAAEVREIKARLDSTRDRLRRTKARLARTKQEQAQVAAALAESQRRLQERELTLARRMAANYRQGPVRYASVLLGSRSMRDMVSRAYVVRTIVRYDAQLIAEIKNDRLNVLKWKQQADAKARQVTEQMRELAVRQEEQARDTRRMRHVLAEARTRRAEIEDELAALEADSERIAARIRALQETPLGRARRLIAFTGGFLRPVDGPITSRFGMRYHPILHVTKLHTGIDFGAGIGTPILAAADGVVIFAGYMRGYGNSVVIDHGGGVSTLYGHQSEIVAVEGQNIARGQMVGRVGMTGYTTGPHLHFEIRKNGTPVNPMGSL
ncbi:MAG: peptidoglycan DD-metalloendopeptidase family protein [Capsulimonadales bacterium]|nr:peptidoglycan DD-metalloendopeptidase family protein [Capsulimonadales bacterium]